MSLLIIGDGSKQSTTPWSSSARIKTIVQVRVPFPLLCSPILNDAMNTVNDNGEDGIHAIVDQKFKMQDGILLAHLQVKSLLDLPHGLVWLNADIGDIGVHHEAEQIEDQVAGFAQCRVGGEAVLFERDEIRRVGAAHAFDHFLAELHRRRKRLRVTAEYVTEVGVEEVT